MKWPQLRTSEVFLPTSDSTKNLRFSGANETILWTAVFLPESATTKFDETRALPLSYGPEYVFAATGIRTRNLVRNRHVVPSGIRRTVLERKRGDKIGKTFEHGVATAGVITLHFARFDVVLPAFTPVGHEP